jgi:hypothetical protein
VRHKKPFRAHINKHQNQLSAPISYQAATLPENDLH